MSTTDGRRERMQRVLKEIANSKPPGLTPNEIALQTQVLTEIQMDRLYKYLAELEWCGMLIRRGNRYSINPDVSIKNERERRIELKKGREKEKKAKTETKK